MTMNKPMTIFGQYVDEQAKFSFPVIVPLTRPWNTPVRMASQGLFTIYVYEMYDKYNGCLLLRNTPIVLEHYDAGLPYDDVDRIIGHLEDRARELAGEILTLIGFADKNGLHDAAELVKGLIKDRTSRRAALSTESIKAASTASTRAWAELVERRQNDSIDIRLMLNLDRHDCFDLYAKAMTHAAQGNVDERDRCLEAAGAIELVWLSKRFATTRSADASPVMRLRHRRPYRA